MGRFFVFLTGGMRKNSRSSLYWSILPFIGLIMLGWLGWNAVKSLPSRYIAQMPKFVQHWVFPEPESAVLPAPSQPINADELLALQPNALPPQTAVTPTLQPEATPTPAATPTPTPIPSPTPTPLPGNTRLTGVIYQSQDWNNCGPATLSMALSYFGVAHTQYQTAAFLKPNGEDRNVTPGEMAAYVNTQTNYRAIERVNGSLEMLKQFLVNHIPVIIEVGDRAPTEVSWVDSEPGAAYREWWGHYLLVAGYDDATSALFVYDSLIWDIPTETNSPQGDYYTYENLAALWPQFNRAFIVLYPPEQGAIVTAILGENMADSRMWQMALERSQNDISQDNQNAFYWFNLGSAYSALQMYSEAATAFDEARTIGLPWRMMWYQFGPYESYYQVGRYVDVILLADATLQNRPYFEESFYYRGLAQLALGDSEDARINFQAAATFNPHFEPAIHSLQSLQG